MAISMTAREPGDAREQVERPRIKLLDQLSQSDSKIFFDLYGYMPHHFPTYMTWIGTVCSILMLCTWAGLMVYSFSQLFRTYWNIQEAAVPGTAGFYATPSTALQVPRIQAGFRLPNGSTFYDPKYLTITFTQRFTYITPEGVIDPTGNGACTKSCATKVPLDTVQCYSSAPDGSNAQTEMRCGKPISRPGATDLPSIYNGELPAFQGQYGDPIYAFVQVEWNFNMTVLDQEPDMADLLYGGNTFMSVDWSYLALNQVTMTTSLDSQRAVDSQRWYPQRLQAPRIEWTVRRRSITFKNPVLAIDQLDTPYDDYILGLPASAYTDTPAKKVNETFAQTRDRGLLLKVYFHMDKEEMIVTLQPSNTIVAFLAGAGGLITILSIVFGSVGRCASFYSFTKSCNEAYRMGTIPESFFEEPSSCRLKLEHTNRTVYILNGMQMSTADMRRSISNRSSQLMGSVRRMSRSNSLGKPRMEMMSSRSLSPEVNIVCDPLPKSSQGP